MTKQAETRDRVLDLIEQLGVGDSIPSERQLSADLGVSRLTVRAALDELVREGYLVRRRGAGTFVTEPKIAQELTMTSFTDDMRRRGMSPASRTLGNVCTSATSLGYVSSWGMTRMGRGGSMRPRSEYRGQRGALEERLPIDGNRKTMNGQQVLHLIETATFIVDFDHGLTDPPPMLQADSRQYFPLTLLHVHFQQIDARDVFLIDDF